MKYTVQTTGLTKSFGNHRALEGVDLSIKGGSVLALLGPNGAGKTTMVRILATLVRPDAGAASVAGHDLLTDSIGVKRAISLTGQYTAVDDLLSGQENLQMMARLRHLPRRDAKARTDELLSIFDLEDARHRRVATYSGGMRRRLDLAISVIVRPQLLFLDEPTTGLDPRGREQLFATARRLVDEGVTILLTTQYLEEADELADRIAMLDRGRVVAQGSASQLKASLGSEVVRLEFDDVRPFRCAADLLHDARVDELQRTLEVDTDGTVVHVHDLLSRLVAAGGRAERISIRRPSLDDVFLTVTGGSGHPESKEAA
jgi:ABC-2 type transport system ATP-binding protein